MNSKRASAQQPHRSFSAFQFDQITDYRATAEALLPKSEASVVQLQPGPAPSNLVLFSSDKVGVLGLSHHAASVGVVVNQPGWFSFMWWGGPEECRINGELARNSVLFAQGAHDGFHAAGGVRRTMGISARRSHLIETIAALRGVGPEDVLLNRTALELPVKLAARFRVGVNVLVESAINAQQEGVAGASTADPSEAILGLLVDAYVSSSHDQLREYRTHPPELVVRRAEERYFEAQGNPISLADLCVAAGVSQSALYRAFHAVCNMPPLAYFHKRRLTDARRALIKSPADRGAVKRTALAVGVTELGRFSVEYRRLFGESPSTTLRTSAGDDEIDQIRSATNTTTKD